MENDCDDEHMAEVNKPNQTIDMSASAVIEMMDLCGSDDEMEEMVTAASVLALTPK